MRRHVHRKFNIQLCLEEESLRKVRGIRWDLFQPHCRLRWSKVPNLPVEHEKIEPAEGRRKGASVLYGFRTLQRQVEYVVVHDQATTQKHTSSSEKNLSGSLDVFEPCACGFHFAWATGRKTPRVER
jgi:hypothetical protein